MEYFKREYTKEEIDEIVDWFKSHKFEQDIDLGEGLHITKLDKALKQFCYVAKINRENPNFLGPIAILFRIKDELEKQGKVLE